MTQVTQAGINKAAWGACDALSGVVEEHRTAADIEKLRTEEKALMQRLFTGKRRVVT